jgi:hypothetical protein
MARDMQLLKPTPHVIELFTQGFQDRYGGPENAIKLLLQKFPDNRTLESILLKSIVINVLYATQILAIIPVAEHILSLDIDGRLSQGLPEVVDEIATVRIKEKVRTNYSFATKYCSFHNSPNYPIYDLLVDKLLNAYQRQDRFASSSLGNLKNYLHFEQILKDFREFYGLTDVGAKQLDSFLWLYGREVFGSTGTKSV